ncbi:hypothetical protein [Streptomyces sp. EN23]|uniref:hypothetical protein n=1 Tax=Streptomyces sp. EN23 TaxID=212774 RepID=UPI00210BD265|nr:hypothetical protein [Streptomyces sp. EN23]
MCAGDLRQFRPELRCLAVRLSSYITEAVRHQLAMDGLTEIVASLEEEHGALTEQEIEAARRELFGDVNAEDVERGAA